MLHNKIILYIFAVELRKIKSIAKSMTLRNYNDNERCTAGMVADICYTSLSTAKNLIAQARKYNNIPPKRKITVKQLKKYAKQKYALK